MRKLNNRGITTIEVIVCFVLVTVITVSMYSMITSLNEKRMIEGYKARIYTYKNVLTREIQSDLIKKGLTHVNYNKNDNGSLGVEYTINFDLKDGSKRKLVINQRIGKSDYHLSGIDGVSDSFMIKYGDPTDMLEYPLPDLGKLEDDESHTIAKDLSINNVTVETIDNVLSIYIGLYHPELETRYSINITCPIDYHPESIQTELPS